MRIKTLPPLPPQPRTRSIFIWPAAEPLFAPVARREQRRQEEHHHPFSPLREGTKPDGKDCRLLSAREYIYLGH